MVYTLPYNLLLCVINFYLSSSKEYVVTSSKGNWQYVKEQCEQNGMILATFDDVIDVSKIYNKCNYNECYLGFEDHDFDREFEFVDDGEVVDDEAKRLWARGEPDRGVHPLHTCGCMIKFFPNFPPKVLADCWCVGFSLPGVCEIIDVEAEEMCDDFIYYDNYGPANWLQADMICNAEQAGLASITSQEQCDCLKQALDGRGSAWMGLNSRNNQINFYEYIDGTSCPSDHNGLYSGACMGPKCWENKKPLCKEDGGKRCVGISSKGLNNQINCGNKNKRNGILCNKK